MRERLAQRFLGLELAGARNSKTAISVLEFYPKEKKVFLLDIHEKIVAREGQTNDDALLELLEELGSGLALMGVNVPLSLPPCFICKPSQCKSQCRSRATQWMERFAKKRPHRKGELQVTPYTQRPVELWIRHEVLASFPRNLQFDIDETLGGNRAPLTARMHYLQRKLRAETLVETLPKLTALKLCISLGMDRRILSRYRKLEEGSHARALFLESLIEKRGVFIYDRDLKKLSQSLSAFDSFLCAYTALLAAEGKCEKVPRGFPENSGWIQYPSSEA